MSDTTYSLPQHPSGWGPLVRGKCPACGFEGLFLGSNGYVTCASLRCPDPSAATDLLLAARPVVQEPEPEEPT